MKSSIQIVHGGGWIRRQSFGRPRTRFFGCLSAVWLPISLLASIPFWVGWPEPDGQQEWLFITLLVLQAVFLVLAAVFLLTETPVNIVEHSPNPDYDMKKLY